MSESENLIRSNVNFETPGSWNRVFCPVCGDGTHEKGPRGGWKFEGDSSYYNCFNCGIKGSLDFTREYPLSKDMFKILSSFGITYKMYADLILRSEKKEYVRPVFSINTKKISIPKWFVNISEAPKVFISKINQVLDDHSLQMNDYQFWFSLEPEQNECGSFDDYLYYKSIANRLIIPAFHKGAPIFYEARRLSDNKTPKYISCKGVKKSETVYLMDNIYQKTNAPLYITEGFFDAYHLNGIATMRNEISKTFIDLLNNIDRPKVVVPDRNNDYEPLAETAISNDWGISTVNFGDCKDVCENVKRYGKLMTSKTLYESICYGAKARLMLKTLNRNKM